MHSYGVISSMTNKQVLLFQEVDKQSDGMSIMAIVTEWLVSNNNQLLVGYLFIVCFTLIIMVG